MRLDEVLTKAALALNVEAPTLLIRTDIESAEREGNAIAFNPNWIARTIQKSCYSYDSRCVTSITFGIVAHELTHFVFQDPERTSPDLEERADRYAREVLKYYSLPVEPFNDLVSRTVRSYAFRRA